MTIQEAHSIYYPPILALSVFCTVSHFSLMTADGVRCPFVPSEQSEHAAQAMWPLVGESRFKSARSYYGGRQQ